ADPARAFRVIEDLHGLGIQFAIDDFGTGYSSLAYLKRLPASEVKIDKSFVMDMISDENDRVIVKSTIDLANNMGLRPIAEGVEHKEVMEKLLELGCETVQGFYLCRPLPPEEVLARIDTLNGK
ncbi:MAG: EAL domain-containing protein, partial [Desulfobulbaceae bacterium]|nr:EAL domain-containing protein [Desulfobulbaceae bacterium]